ncbi:hypothetical protein CBI35_16985 [Pantoea sp. AV62]|nr:hypothetical protein CBI35_16985 [Pantoea sp. AV62]
MRAVRRKGRNEHGPVQMSGSERKNFWPHKKIFRREASAVPGQPGGLCLSQPRRKDSDGRNNP